MSERSVETERAADRRRHHDDSGTAFPLPRTYEAPGMSLRDYFAGQALVGILACRWPPAAPENCCGYAYKFADAMLLVREKVEP